jgi:hypothetical protein
MLGLLAYPSLWPSQAIAHHLPFTGFTQRVGVEQCPPGFQAIIDLIQIGMELDSRLLRLWWS